MAKVHKVRCRNSKCRHRRNSSVHPDEMLVIPACKCCGQSKGWRVEGRFWLAKQKTCRCNGVPYPHQYLHHSNCLDVVKKTMLTRQFAPIECPAFVCDSNHASRLMVVYEVRETMAYIAAHDESEAIKVLENNYPQAHSLLLTKEDIKPAEIFRTIQVYDYADTSNDKPPFSNLWDLWVEALTPRVLSVNSTIKGLINDVQQETSNLDEIPF